MLSKIEHILLHVYLKWDTGNKKNYAKTMLYIHVHIQAGSTEERVNPFLYNTNNKQVDKLEFTRFYLCQDSPIPYQEKETKHQTPNLRRKKVMFNSCHEKRHKRFQ